MTNLKLFSKKSERIAPVLAALLLIFAITVGGTVAYLIAKSDQVTNTFTPGHVDPPDIPEEFDEQVKKNVKVTVKGDVDCYGRAMVVFTFQDDDGNTVAETPVEGTDYTVTYGDSWQLVDGIWYYKGIVAAEADTDVLIVQCKTRSTKYHLVVDILSQTIQADGVVTSGANAGTPAVEEAWGMRYSGGTWSAV